MGNTISKVLRKLKSQGQPQPQPLQISGPTNVVHVTDWSLPGIPTDQLQMLHDKSVADAAMRFPKDKSNSAMEKMRKHVRRASWAVRKEFVPEEAAGGNGEGPA